MFSKVPGIPFVSAAAAALCAVACGDSPAQPKPPVSEAPKIVCPSSQTITSPTGLPVGVVYQAATVVGGTSPVMMACTPASASMFPLGTTSVTCRVTDALNRTDACSFAIVVAAPPRIAVTKFVAFGDSITDGVLGIAPFAVGDAGPSVGYAYKLRTLLSNRYTAQTISMTDEGVPGEDIAKGVARLPGTLTRDQPDALLLLEGVNDLNNGHDAAIPTIINGLSTMVREARGRGLPVFLATLLPQRPNGPKAYAPASIPPANAAIRDLAAREGAVLVDLFAAFDGQTSTLIGNDGLHPNEKGYQKMAEVFFDAIRARLELAAMPLRSQELTATPLRSH